MQVIARPRLFTVPRDKAPEDWELVDCVCGVPCYRRPDLEDAAAKAMARMHPGEEIVARCTACALAIGAGKKP